MDLPLGQIIYNTSKKPENFRLFVMLVTIRSCTNPDGFVKEMAFASFVDLDFGWLKLTVYSSHELKNNQKYS